ncbi:MAG TPA: stomatin-like protein, partial [Chroococcidiopsis sp.]
MESILIASTLIIIGYVVGSVKIIEQGSQALVQRLGRHQRTLDAGLNFVVPLLDRIVIQEFTKEKVLDIDPQDAITQDNVPVSVDAVMYWQILDLKLAYYGVDDIEEALKNLVITTLRSQIGKMTFAETLSSRDEINRGLVHQLDDATGKWGVKVMLVEVQKIEPSKAIKEALEQERAAMSRKEALIVEAEGKRKASIAEAQGKKEAAIAEAEGMVQSMQMLASALKDQSSGAPISNRQILQYMVAQKYVDANMKLGSSPNAK